MSLPEPPHAEPAEIRSAEIESAATESTAAEPAATDSTAAGSAKTGRPVPDVQPMEIDLTLLLAVGTGLFALSFVGLLAFHSELSRNGHGNWPWIALTGTVFGLVGLASVRRRARAGKK